MNEHTIKNNKVTMRLVNVENEFLGLSLTESEGLTMRRVATEIREVGDMIKMRDVLNAMIERQKSRPA